MQISEILNQKGSDVKVVAMDGRLRAAMAIMHQAQIGSVVVVDADGSRPVGLIAQAEMLDAFATRGAGALDAPVQDIMTTPLYCPASICAERLMAQMTMEKRRHAIVVDEGDAMLGIVSIGDLVASRIQDLTTESQVLRDLARSRVLAA